MEIPQVPESPVPQLLDTGMEAEKGHSNPGQGLPCSVLCFRHVLGQDTGLGIWEGFGEPHGTLQTVCHGTTFAATKASCGLHATLNGMRYWCLSKEHSFCAACSQCGQQNCLVWQLF